MEFVSIDLGNYKTVIGSSKDNGRVYTDEQGKRSIKTVLELTTPFRKFGNSITGECQSTISVRHRMFKDSCSSEDLILLSMFFKYLDRIIKANTPASPSIMLSVPASYSIRQRKLIKETCRASGLKLAGMVTDITALAYYACLRREKIPSLLGIFDFGYSKTTFGLFEVTDSQTRVRPLKTVTLPIGARDYDERLTNLILSKYNLQDTVLTRERIRRVMDKLKSTLNSTDFASVELFTDEGSLEVRVTQEEYRGVVEDLNERIKGFIEEQQSKDGKEERDSTGSTDGIVHWEVTGGHSSSFLVKEVLTLPYHVTLQEESAAIGGALGMACGILSTKYKLTETVGRNILIKTNEEANEKTEGENGTILFNKEDPVGTEKEWKDGKAVIMDEDGEVVLTKKKSPALFYISKYLTVECRGDESSLLGEEVVAAMEDEERKYRELEGSLEKVGSMRNDLETMVMELSGGLIAGLPGVFSEEDLSVINEVAMDLFDVRPSETVKEEEEVKNGIVKRLGFVVEKMVKINKKEKKELEEIKEEIKKFKEDNGKVFTASMYKLQGIMYKVEKRMKEEVDLYNVGKYNMREVEEYKKEMKNYIEKANKEIANIKKDQQKKDEEEEKKEEEEEKKDEEEEKKDEEEEKKDEEEEKEDQTQDQEEDREKEKK